MAKNNRILITLSKEREEIVRELMREDMEESEPLAGYISRLIVKEAKRRKDEKQREAEKRSPGRPRKDGGSMEDEQESYKPEEPIYPHPDQIMNAGVMLTKTELETYQAFKAGKLNFQ